MKKVYRKQALKNGALTNNYLLLVLKILSDQIKDFFLLYFSDKKNKLIHYVSPILILSLLNLLSNSVNAQITGTNFRDYNGNVIKDVNEVGIGGISVTAYNITGIALSPVTTANDGTYTTPSVTGKVRIEFTVPETIGCFNENVFPTALGAGQNNHTYDIAYIDTPCPTLNCGTVTVQKN
jgi:SdrD B-like domain